ncbi:matrilin-1-like [Lampetra fluviatilis]
MSPRGEVPVVPSLLSMVAVFMAVAAMVVTADMFRPGIVQQNDDDEHIISRRSQDCSNKQTADVYLLVDGSGSVGARNFQLVLKFLAKLVDKLDIGKDKVRVGMVQYSGHRRRPKIKTEFDLGKYADKGKLKDAIQGTKYMRGFTFTGAALRHTLQLFKRQGRPGVGKILVLVTDGKASDRVKNPSYEVKSSGIVLFSVGVGKADRKELAIMASTPVDKHMFHATNFAGLDSIITTLTSTVCTAAQEAKAAVPVTAATQAVALPSKDCSNKQTADVYLLVDGSGSVGARNFQLVLKFLAKLVDKLDIGKDKVRVGMVQYSGHRRRPKIKTEFDLGQYADKGKLKDAIQGTKYMRGFTFTGAALRHTLQLFKRQGRPGVGKILVLVTDGEASDRVKNPSYEVKSSGIVLFSVGVGKADRKELAIMASTPVDKHMFHATNFAGLDSIITTLTSTVCTAAQEAKAAVPVTAVTQAVALPSKDCSNKQTADVYLLVDGSGSVGARNFQLVLKFLAKLVDKLDIGKDKVRVGMVQYSGHRRRPKIKTEFDLGQYADKGKLKDAIQGTKYMRGFTFTGAALRHTLQLFKRQGRPGVGKILVLVTDGEASDRVKNPSYEVKSSGIVLFSVGVGKADRKELAIMASTPVDKHMFHATNFAGLDSIITTLTSTVCTAAQEAKAAVPVTAVTQAVALPSKGVGGLCGTVSH